MRLQFLIIYALHTVSALTPRGAAKDPARGRENVGVLGCGLGVGLVPGLGPRGLSGGRVSRTGGLGRREPPKRLRLRLCDHAGRLDAALGVVVAAVAAAATPLLARRLTRFAVRGVRLLRRH